MAVLLLVTGCNPATGAAVPVGAVVPVDGDSLVGDVDGTNARIRVLGIDAPELGECGHDEAHHHLQTLLTDHPGNLQLVGDAGETERDRYGRVLGYLHAGNVDLGLTMVRDGYAAAWWPRSATTPTRAAALTAAQQDAQHTHRGLWAMCDTIGRPR